MRTSRPPKSNSSPAYLPSYRQGFVLLLTLMLGVFLTALVARTYQSETQSKAHSKILLDRLKIYQEAQAVALLGLDSLRNIPRTFLTASPTSLPIASGMGSDWQVLASEVDGGTNLLLGLDYQRVSQSEIRIEVLLSITQFDVTELAYHQRESPDLPPMLIWDVSEDQELVEASLRHWVWLADAWTKPPFDFSYSGSQQLDWSGENVQIASDNHSLMVPLSIFVDGNLILNLPSASDFEEVDSQLLIWVSGKLILQAGEGSGPVSFNGIAVVEGEDCIQQLVSEIYWSGHLSCIDNPSSLGLFHIRQKNWAGGSLKRPLLRVSGVRATM